MKICALDTNGWSVRDLPKKTLSPTSDQSSRISAVLSRRRQLSLQMVTQLHDGLRIPYESLLSAT